jgi:hypothetical protein
VLAAAVELLLLLVVAALIWQLVFAKKPSSHAAEPSFGGAPAADAAAMRA